MASTSETVELPWSRCYDFPENGTHFGCDLGRCCSKANYCGSTTDYCRGYCLFQCSAAHETGDDHVISSSINNNVTTEVVVKVMRNTVIYDDQNSLSCANSLKNLSLASLHKYAWASFHVNNNAGTASICGRCLKLTNVESGVEATVRVVHEPTTGTTEGVVELGTSTFNKLRAEDDHHDIAVKYNFESCD
ncbi:Wound-induced protein WIN2 [Linum grandiflorum]